MYLASYLEYCLRLLPTSRPQAAELVAEIMELKTSNSKLKMMTGLLLAVTGVLSIATVSTSFVAMTASTRADEMGHLVTAQGQSVATVGHGEAFHLKLHPGDDNQSVFACATAEEVVNMWQSTMDGVNTNAVLVAPDASNGTANEVGLSLSFEGAMQNATHACIPTVDGKYELCFDSTSDACDGGEGGNHQRRQLQSLRDTAARVGSLIVALTQAIQNQASPHIIASLTAAKKAAEAEHTILQMAYGAATG